MKTLKYELDELSIKINIAILISVLFIVAYFYIQPEKLITDMIKHSLQIQHLIDKHQNPSKTLFIQSSQLNSQSELTIVKLDESLLTDPKYLIQEQLKKYTLQQRKYLIIDKSSGAVIDSRDQKAFQKVISRSLLPTSYTNNTLMLSNIDDGPYLKQKWKSQKEEISDAVWNDHWQQFTKIHQQFLNSIIKNKIAQFDCFMNKRHNVIPIQINYKSQSNWCPIHYAAMHSSPAILSRLINHPQIDVNALTDFKMTPLHIAVQSSKYQNCELLLNAGVCIDYKDQEGNTALHYAAQFGSKDIIKLLIKSGASQYMKNMKDLTAKQSCRTEDIKQLFTAEEQADKKQDFFYKFKRNNFVQKMLSFANKNEKKIQQQQKNKNKQNLKKITAKQGREQNITKMYQLMINRKNDPITLSSFKFYKKIGEGAFGQVYVVKKGKSEKTYALKAIKKQRVIGTALQRYIRTEKQILSLLNHPFIVKLHYAFQTQAYLFLVMDYCEGGDLSRVLQKKQRFQQKVVKLYAAQILLGLEALHKHMIIYRDLKPQNIVLDRQGHACITDFGLSKKKDNLDQINKSFCGTPAYLPLQIINKKGHTRMADWYQFGVVLYELMTGIPPFYAETRSQLYQKVRAGVIRFPKNSSQNFRDLIKQLLAQNPQKRLGFENDAQSVKNHVWFSEVDWQEVLERKQKMPALQNKVKLSIQPIKTKFADIKSEKYVVPSWSFVEQ